MCVAGVDIRTGRHVRPVLRRQMRTAMLACHGGVFEIGAIVDLGRTRGVGRPPEIEDQLFVAKNAVAQSEMPPAEFWKLNVRSARRWLVEVFGPDLERLGYRSCVMPEGKGRASLGCFIPEHPRLRLDVKDGRHRVRMTFCSGHHEFDVPVTDIRLFADDHITPDRGVVEQTAKRLINEQDIVLSVGLGRAFKKTAGEPARHWMQVNNIHFASDPCWKLGVQGVEVSAL